MNWLDSYMEYTDDSEAPAIFRKWSGISTIAACLRRKVWMDVEGRIFPNLYIVLCGPSGSRKGTAMGPCRAFLQNLGINITAESLTREGLIVALARSTFSEIFPDGGMMVHSSLTVFSTELAVFIKAKDDGLISALTNWFDCEDPWRYETKNSGTFSIDGVWLNLIGATTPELLRVMLPESAIGGGLTSRIIFIYASKKGKISPWVEVTPEKQKLEQKLLRELEDIRDMTGQFNYTKDYKDAYIEWYIDSEKNPPYIDYHFEPYLTRRALHIRKVSMIMSASRSRDMLLTVEDFERAKAALLEAESRMCNVYRAYGRSDLAELFSRVMALILVRDRISFDEILRRFYRDATVDELSTMIDTLQQMGELKVSFVVDKNGNKKKWITPTARIGDPGMGDI